MEPEEAADCIRIADEFGEEMLRRHGSRIAFCADELSPHRRAAPAGLQLLRGLRPAG
ncbi:MAG: hypothetical protein ACLTY5_00215 [Angelakisella sp.]